MIVEESPLYFELEVVYKLLKLHIINAMEESNFSQHTKQTHTYIGQYLAQSTNNWRNSHTNYFHIYVYIYCTTTIYIAVSAVLHQ